MSKSPMNYLLSIAIIALFWVIFSIFIGQPLADSVTLVNITVDDFLNYFRIFLGVAALINILLISYWFYYGSKDSTAGELIKAKRKYTSLFISLIVIAVMLLVAMVIILLSEGIVPLTYVYIFLMLSGQTFFLFWLCTYLFSPRTVSKIPFFK